MTEAADRYLISVVVPVFNSERSLPELVARIAAVADEAGIAEVILVDDRSADASWEVIRGLAQQLPMVRAVRLTRNAGQHAALLAGIRYSTGALVVTMDDDLQHRPEDIPALVAAVMAGADLAYGRSLTEEHGAFRNVTSRFAKATVAVAAGADVATLASGFRCFRGDYRPVLIEPRGPYVSLDVLLSWVAAKVVGVPVVMDQRRYGNSNYTLGRLVRHALNMLFGYTTAPLRVVSYLGAAVGLFGLFLLVFIVARTLISGVAVPGFAFVASMVALFSGFQIMALGVLGEYLARLYQNVLKRPAYVVDTTIRVEDAVGSSASGTKHRRVGE